MRKRVSSQTPTTLRTRIADIIGRTEDPSVLNLVCNTLSSRWRLSKRSVHQIKNGRSEAEILCGARVLQEFTLLATRTYEGKSVTTGIIVAEEWAFDKPSRHWRWLARWPEDSRPTVSERSELMAIAALADGKRSFIVAEPTGRIRGIINNVRDSKGLIINAFGYVVVTNRHREVFLFDQDPEPICYHNGFEWRHGGYIGPLSWVDYWAHYEKNKPFIDQVLRGELPVSFPDWEDSRRWLAFDDLIEALSDRRLSAIFAICDSATLKKFQIRALLSSLRPELDNVQWGGINNNIPVWVNLFKLDGAHFLSKQMRIMAVCQRISVPANYGSAEGTGRTAARFLSKQLGALGVVIKVSSDGPTSIFHEGQIIDDWIESP